LQILILIIQIVTAVALIALLAVQTDKTEQGGGGVMGLGAAGGRTAGNVSMAVGAERILKPLTIWMAIGFLFSSFLNAIPDDKLTVIHVLGSIVLYLIVMTIGSRLWAVATRSAG
jgi:protein translocase SecG subunit